LKGITMLHKNDVKRLEYLKTDCYLEGEYVIDDLKYFLTNSFAEGHNMLDPGDSSFEVEFRRELASNFNLCGIIFIDFEKLEIELVQDEKIFTIFREPGFSIWKLRFVAYVTEFQYYK